MTLAILALQRAVGEDTSGTLAPASAAARLLAHQTAKQMKDFRAEVFGADLVLWRRASGAASQSNTLVMDDNTLGSLGQSFARALADIAKRFHGATGFALEAKGASGTAPGLIGFELSIPGVQFLDGLGRPRSAQTMPKALAKVLRAQFKTGGLFAPAAGTGERVIAQSARPLEDAVGAIEFKKLADERISGKDIANVIRRITARELHWARIYAREKGRNLDETNLKLLFAVAVQIASPESTPGHAFIAGADLEGSDLVAYGWYPAESRSLPRDIDNLISYNPQNPQGEVRSDIEHFQWLLQGDAHTRGMAYLVTQATYDKVMGRMKSMDRSPTNMDYSLFVRSCTDGLSEALAAGGIRLEAVLWPGNLFARFDQESRRRVYKRYWSLRHGRTPQIR